MSNLFASNTNIIFRLLFSAFFLSAGASFGQVTTIVNQHLQIEVNASLKTQVRALFLSGSPLMNGYAGSEYLETKYFTAKEFTLIRKEEKALSDKSGNGTEWRFYGMNKENQLEKILSIRIYKQFADAAYFSVVYINHSKQNLRVKKWVNHAYDLLPSPDTTKFWSFQGSSHSDRRDWIRPVNAGFSEKNFMGMNAADYGGGIPVIDLWRKDNGLSIGLTEPEAKLISLPVDYDQYSLTAQIGLEYNYPNLKTIAPGDTLHCFETFVGVHQKDCFTTLQTYGAYMQTKGIVPAPAEPSAFEPVWCAWGYERNFTLAEIYHTLPKVKALGIKWVGLDDGFQQANGDWHTNASHFPGGDKEMKAFVDSLHSMGLKAVIWWAPLAMDISSEVFKKNPNIALVQRDGSLQ